MQRGHCKQLKEFPSPQESNHQVCSLRKKKCSFRICFLFQIIFNVLKAAGTSFKTSIANFVIRIAALIIFYKWCILKLILYIYICMYVKASCEKRNAKQTSQHQCKALSVFLLVTNPVQIKSTLATLKINLTAVQPFLFGVLV